MWHGGLGGRRWRGRGCGVSAGAAAAAAATAALVVTTAEGNGGGSRVLDLQPLQHLVIVDLAIAVEVHNGEDFVEALLDL